MTDSVGIIGLGLIGGSLGLDLRGMGYQVLGIAREEDTCHKAIALGVVDRASCEYTLLEQAEIIFICTPIGAIVPTFRRIRPYLKPETIVSDVGSVKVPIVKAISPLWPYFLGGHPMAGTAQQGIDAAQTHLFAEKPYVITPTPTTPPDVIKRVESLVNTLGSCLHLASPEDHDRAVAWISHLPLMVSATLIDACMGETDPKVLELAQKLASSGFQDTSRVGGGNPELGSEIARANRLALLDSLHQYQDHLKRLIQFIEKENWENLEQLLQQTEITRKYFLRN